MTETPDAFLKAQAKDYKSLITGSVILRYVSALLLIAQSGAFAFVVNAYIFEKQELEQFTPYIVLLFIGAGLRYGLSVWAERKATYVASQIQHQMRERLYARLQARGPLYVTDKGSAALLESLSSGTDTIGAYYSQYMPAQALMKYVPLTILLLVLPLDWLSGVVMIVTAPLIPLFMILIGKGAEVLNQKQWRKLAVMSNHFLDCLQGLTTLKIFSAEERASAQIAQVAEQYRIETMRVLRLAFLSSVTLEFFSTVSIALIAVFIGFRLMWAEMDFLHGFFILLLAPEFYAPLRNLGAAYHARMEAIGAAELMQKVLQDETQENVAHESLSLHESPRIKFGHVAFTYPDGRAALHDLSLDFEPGKHYALIGPSGAGKTTIFSLLLGFIAPITGEILINDKPINESLRAQISWVPQNPTLFYASVIENIRLGKQDASDKDIKALCQRLGIHEFIEALPKGYDTLVGEQGYGLSGGQIRRIAIARAFLRDAPLVLMDEPTASLDPKTESILQTAIENLGQGKTVLTIAHRLNTVRRADQIFYIEEGRLMDQGTHAELIKSSPAYARLVNYELIEEKGDAA